MKAFHFKNFSIKQSARVFRVGTDGVLLGAIAAVENSRKILEIGAGTGLISLMLAQRNPLANILALDIDAEAVMLSSANFANAPFKDRLRVRHTDFNEFVSRDKFDLIISNPPYFEENGSEKDVLARQKLALDFPGLIANAAKYLAEDGLLSVIIPSDSTAEFVMECERSNLNLRRKVNIYGISGGPLKRNILEFSKQKSSLMEEDFVIEEKPRIYSEQYLETTKDFHVFKQKDRT